MVPQLRKSPAAFSLLCACFTLVAACFLPIWTMTSSYSYLWMPAPGPLWHVLEFLPTDARRAQQSEESVPGALLKLHRGNLVVLVIVLGSGAVVGRLCYWRLWGRRPRK